MNNVSYHRHGDRRSNQMKSKTEMAEQLCGIVVSGNFGALAQCAMPTRTRRPTHCALTPLCDAAPGRSLTRPYPLATRRARGRLVFMRRAPNARLSAHVFALGQDGRDGGGGESREPATLHLPGLRPPSAAGV